MPRSGHAGCGHRASSGAIQDFALAHSAPAASRRSRGAPAPARQPSPLPRSGRRTPGPPQLAAARVDARRMGTSVEQIDKAGVNGEGRAAVAVIPQVRWMNAARPSPTGTPQVFYQAKRMPAEACQTARITPSPVEQGVYRSKRLRCPTCGQIVTAHPNGTLLRGRSSPRPLGRPALRGRMSNHRGADPCGCRIGRAIASR